MWQMQDYENGRRTIEVSGQAPSGVYGRRPCWCCSLGQSPT